MASTRNTINIIDKLLEKEEYLRALEAVEGEQLEERLLCGKPAGDAGDLILLTAKVLYHNQLFSRVMELLSILEKSDSGIGPGREFIFLKYQTLLIDKGPEEALDFLESMMISGYPAELRFFIRFCIGKAQFWEGEYHKSDLCFQECLKYYNRLPDHLMLGNVYYMLGYTSFQRSLFEVTESYYEKALENFRTAGRKDQIAATRHMTGILDYRCGRYDRAEENILAAREYYSSTGNRTRLSESYLALGRVKVYQGDLGRAEELIGEALGMAEQTGHRRGVALSCEFMGEICFIRRNYRRALTWLERAEKLADSIAPRGDIMLEVCRRLGDLHATYGNPEDAEIYLSTAFRLAENLNDRYELSLTLRGRGILEFKRGRMELARSYFREAISILKLLKDRYELAETYRIAAGSILEYAGGLLRPPGDETEIMLEAKRYINEAARLYDQLGLGHRKNACSELKEKLDNYVRNVFSSGTVDISFHNSWLFHGFLVARSRYMRNVVSRVSKFAGGDIPVLITGETGTGKEVLARFIHQLSGRKEGAFVPVNCASLTNSVFESELFGHRRGSFTGAFRDHTGLVERASGGTLFLDEISELSHRQQAKLLRLLQERKLRRVGESVERSVDIRVISATNQNVDNLLRRGKLREDFFYRILTESVEIKPLREHRDDVYALFSYYMEQFGDGAAIREDALGLLQNYFWPGNVRQLVSVTRVLSMAAGRNGIILKGHLPLQIRNYRPENGVPGQTGGTNLLKIKPIPSIGLTRDPKEVRRLVVSTLMNTDGNKSEAARRLGVSRSTLYRIIKKLDII